VSRIGRKPVVLPPNVEVKIQGSTVFVKGPKGKLEYTFPPSVDISLENGSVLVNRLDDSGKQRSLHGTVRAVISNMVTGVGSGFERSRSTLIKKLARLK
jgi:large subunit ribosomal protein L6